MFVHVLPARDFVAEAQNSFSHCLKLPYFLKEKMEQSQPLSKCQDSIVVNRLSNILLKIPNNIIISYVF